MILKNSLIALSVAGLLFTASSSFAAGAKTYQVTGPVLAVTDTTVTVQKGDDKWEINRGSVKVKGELKVGAKVTIEYTMTAADIEVKGDKPAKKK